MEMEELDDFYKVHRFKPSDEEAVTYFLPRLLAGEALPHGADRLICHADIYACEPRVDLAAEYAPVPSAVSTGDRFFFTTCRRKKGRCARVAGAGTWAVQKTDNVYRADGVKVGEVKHLSFKKGKASTGWVMEEYRCLLPEAIVDGGEKVLCKIHLAPNAPAAARQESEGYKLRQERAEPPVQGPEPVTVTLTASAHKQKRPAPVAAADLSSCKKMRMAAPVPDPEPEIQYEDCPVWFTPAAAVSSPAASTEVPATSEADDDMGRLCCSWEELLGEQQEQTLPIEQPGASIDWESEVQEERTLAIDQPVASVDGEFSEELQSLLADHDEEEAVLYKGCNFNAATADLQAPWLEGRNQFFSFGAVN
uniref:Uncharacterized protein n=1 Tax=Avena sativa TaxID=4498 RepID=A0ACD6AF35_AVESA